MKFLLWYLITVNAFGLLLMLADKRRAQRGKWRIPEMTLFTVAALGGSVGSIAGMYLFRHKTRHRTFTAGMPLILAVQLLCAFLLTRALT